MTPKYWQQAISELSDRDVVLEKLIDRYSNASLKAKGNAFQTLAKSIVGQQISIRAADSVWKKLVGTLCEISPDSISSASNATLRNCGLSQRKAIYLGDLALHFMKGNVEPQRFSKMEDEEIIDERTQVKGIGRWTAEMFLIFFLMRPNVFPIGDLGLRRALELNYGKGRPLSQRKVDSLSNKWTPWRSVATWYLWRSLDPIPVEY